MFVDALTYPFRGGGWVMILTGTILAVVLDVAAFAPLFGVVAAVFGAGYFAGFYLDIVATTMIGDDYTPEWPSFSAFADDILMPLLRMFGLLLICFVPTAAVVFTMDAKDPAYAWASGGATAFGVLYFPMAVLGSVVYGNLFGALPHVVIPAIFRVLPSYLLAVAGFAVAVAAANAAEEFGGRIPYVGWLVAAAVSIYALMMQARMIGLIYREKREELGWG